MPEIPNGDNLEKRKSERLEHLLTVFFLFSFFFYFLAMRTLTKYCIAVILPYTTSTREKKGEGRKSVKMLSPCNATTITYTEAKDFSDHRISTDGHSSGILLDNRPFSFSAVPYRDNTFDIGCASRRTNHSVVQDLMQKRDIERRCRSLALTHKGCCPARGSADFRRRLCDNRCTCADRHRTDICLDNVDVVSIHSDMSSKLKTIGENENVECRRIWFDLHWQSSASARFPSNRHWWFSIRFVPDENNNSRLCANRVENIVVNVVSSLDKISVARIFIVTIVVVVVLVVLVFKGRSVILAVNPKRCDDRCSTNALLTRSAYILPEDSSSVFRHVYSQCFSKARNAHDRYHMSFHDHT